MVKINRVTTKTGDNGSTGLFGAGRVRKDSVRMEAIGAIDELMAVLGMIRSLEELTTVPKMAQIIANMQNNLFDLGSELAASGAARSPCPIRPKHIKQLESTGSQINKHLPALTSFILPGGSILNSWLHLARVSARKAERKVVRFEGESTLNPLIKIYLNRLSDTLFILARKASQQQKKPELLWKPGA